MSESASETLAPEAPSSAGASRAVRAAYYAFVLWIPIETIEIVHSEGGSNVVTLSRLLGLLLFLLALVDWRRSFRRLPAAFWLIGWYVAAYSVSQVWIPRELDVMFLAKQLILGYSLVLFLVSANLFEDADFRGSVLRFYGWWATVVAIGMMSGLFGDVYREEEGRGTILGQDPNVAAGFFALGAVCLAGDRTLFASKRFLARGTAALAGIAVQILAIIQTGSRGGLTALIAGVLGLAACGDKSTRTRRALIAAAAAATFGGLMLREFTNHSIYAGRLTNTWENGDTAGRTQIYGEAWAMIRERPILGWGGANNFFTLGLRLGHPSYGTFYRDTHNLLLAVLTEVGLVGAVPFAAAVALALWSAWRFGRRTGDAVPFALLAAQVAINGSLTGSNQNLFWVALAAAAACAAPGP